MKLTYAQKKHFFEHGFVKLPGVVPKIMVDDAVKAINHSLGSEGMNKEDLPTLRAQTYCREITQTPVITDLYNKTPAKDLAESVIGEGKINPVGRGQVALRFPRLNDPVGEPAPHIDGIYTPTNGVKQGVVANFTALCSVLLSDLPNAYSGNFTVWPGTHRQYEKYFQKHGPESLLDGMPPIDMPEPIQVTGKAGDVFLAHYQLAHGIAPNASPNIRYAIFFRLYHQEHQNDWRAPMNDLWLHWPGIREIIDNE